MRFLMANKFHTRGEEMEKVTTIERYMLQFSKRKRFPLKNEKYSRFILRMTNGITFLGENGGEMKGKHCSARPR